MSEKYVPCPHCGHPLDMSNNGFPADTRTPKERCAEDLYEALSKILHDLSGDTGKVSDDHFDDGVSALARAEGKE